MDVRLGIRQSFIVALTESEASVTTFDMDTTDTYHGGWGRFPNLYHDSSLTQPRWVNALTTLQLQVDVGAPFYNTTPIKGFINLFPKLEDLSLRCGPWVWTRNTYHWQLIKVHWPVLTASEESEDPRPLLPIGRHGGLALCPQKTLRKLSLSFVVLYASINDPWTNLLSMVRDRLEVEDLSIESCSAARLDNSFPNEGGYYSLSDIRFGEPDRNLSHYGQVVG